MVDTVNEVFNRTGTFLENYSPRLEAACSLISMVGYP